MQLFGEVGDWLRPIAVRDGEVRLSLLPGVYAYKLSIDGVWSIDPACARTRTTGEHQNSVLSVGGAPEPLLFAPAPPWIGDDGCGGVVVSAALRRGHGDQLFVRWSEAGEPERRTPMDLAVEEGEHLVFRALLPISSARATLRFELEGGAILGAEDDPSAPLAWERERSHLPSWWERAVVYTVFVDRFRAADDASPWGADPGPRRAAGGHLEGVRRSLDDLQRLGVDTLYLTPVHVAASCHRYDVVDPLTVDPALGGDEALDRLITDLRARGMRLVVDFSFSHAGRGFPAYEEVIERGPAAPRAGWFQWAGDPPALVHYGTRDDAPLFDLDHPEVRELVIRAAETWASRGVDGLRLDAAAEVPIDLAREVRARLRAISPDALVIGELVPRHAWRWRGEGAIDAATDFGFHAAATDWLAHGSIDAAEAGRRLVELDLVRGAPASASMRFLSTHDHPRFATLARLAGRASDLGLLFLFTSPGVPALLYGEELGLFSEKVEDVENVWPDRMPMPWAREGRDTRLFRLVQRLAAARAGSSALRSGDQEIIHAEGPLLVFRRAGGGEVVDVALNAGAATIVFDMEDDELPVLEPVVLTGDAAFDGQSVALGPGSGAVLRRRPPLLGAAARRLPLLENLAQRDADLRASAVTTRARPTRLDFAVTERCNLRCRHCITAAPDRTRDGSARTLSPRLVDRLRDDLAFAEYAGFVHGGEPLATPALFDVLDALRAARRRAHHGAPLDQRRAPRRAHARSPDRRGRDLDLGLDRRGHRVEQRRRARRRPLRSRGRQPPPRRATTARDRRRSPPRRLLGGDGRERARALGAGRSRRRRRRRLDQARGDRPGERLRRAIPGAPRRGPRPRRRRRGARAGRGARPRGRRSHCLSGGLALPARRGARDRALPRGGRVRQPEHHPPLSHALGARLHRAQRRCPLR